MKWNIVLDSSCDLTKDEQKGDVGIDIVPLSIIVGDKCFTDNDEIDTKELLKSMVEEKEASSTACPSPDDFCKAFLKADNSICITLTGELSGTFNSASLGKEMALEQDPSLKIHLIDSKATAGKMVLIKEKALELIEQGLEFDELLDEVEAIVYSGTKINIDYFLEEGMDDDRIDEIYDYFKESETDNLEAAMDELGEDCTEEEIRLVRIKFMSDMGN